MSARRPAAATATAAAGLLLLLVVAALSIVAPALAADELFSLEPDLLRVIKRRTTVYLPGERGNEGKKWVREFTEEERRDAERDARRVLELLREERALWAGLELPPSVVEEQQAAVNGTATPAAAGSNATAPAAASKPAQRRSLTRKLLSDAADSGADASFNSFLEDIGATLRLPAPAAGSDAAGKNGTAAATAAPVTAAAPAAPAADAALAAAANAAIAEAAKADGKAVAETETAAEAVDKVVEDVDEVVTVVKEEEKGKEEDKAAAEPAAEIPAAETPAAAPQADEPLEPQIGGLYAGRNYEGGFAVSQSYAALDAYEAANAPRAGATAEAPGVALAVGHGQVLEVAGWTLRAYSALDGTPLTAPTPLSALFNVSGPVASSSGGEQQEQESAALVGRAALHFDAHGTGRFFVAAHVQDVGASSSSSSPRSRVVFAVSAGPNIVGSWYVYDLDVGFNGKEKGGKVPERAACTGGKGASSGAQCWAGALALGNDGQAVYLTYDNHRRDPQQGYTFVGANVVALDKFAMASSVKGVAVAEWWVDKNPADGSVAARGIVPALPAPFVYTRATAANFLSLPASASSAEAAANTTTATTPSYLLHYGLKGAKAMRGAAESRSGLRSLLSALRLEVRRLPVTLPAPLVGPAATLDTVEQPAEGRPALLLSTTVGMTAQALEAADFPLGRSLGRDKPAALPAAAGAPARLGGLRYVQDRLYTVASVQLPAAAVVEEGVSSESRVGVWWLEIDQPAMKPLRSGVIAYERGSLLAPTIAVAKGGRAVVAATAVGAELFPSAAVATLDFGAAAREALMLGSGAALDDEVAGVSVASSNASAASAPVSYTLRLPSAGAGFADGEALYDESAAKAAAKGAAAGRLSTASAVGVDGTLWSAAEVVAHACSTEEYRLDATCGGTRTAEFNWATRVTQMEAE